MRKKVNKSSITGIIGLALFFIPMCCDMVENPWLLIPMFAGMVVLFLAAGMEWKREERIRRQDARKYKKIDFNLYGNNPVDYTLYDSTGKERYVDL